MNALAEISLYIIATGGAVIVLYAYLSQHPSWRGQRVLQRALDLQPMADRRGISLEQMRLEEQAHRHWTMRWFHNMPWFGASMMAFGVLLLTLAWWL
ncbi:MAG: hypothetical protein P8Q36_01075 [Alphaproteobacteria bacterium]|jgi:hypothetical protein|nr:hypothetical protein [Rhodospirillaceae bacterium]MBT7615013.1 hypothetical protein [Rhodospirillaceae bacterium]MDG2479448.1 hypothetical protein [Alphaproteobacteria bacterium]